VLPALVLTAGRGTRLDPLTRLVAKPAVPLAGRALVERVLDWLVAQHVSDVVLNLHHLPETITSIVGDGAHFPASPESRPLRVRYSWEMPILGSAGGPRHALDLLASDTFVIVNGDTLCDVALEPMIAAHRASGADVTMAVVPNPAPDHYNGIVLDADDRITGFVPRGHAGESFTAVAGNAGSWHFVGVQIASASVFAELPDGVPAESVHGIYKSRIGASRGGVHAYRVNVPFFDVGTPHDYLETALAIGNHATIEPGAMIESGARVTNSVVWGGATIGEGAVLDRCIVTNVEIPPGFTARDTVFVPASVRRADDSAAIAGTVACFTSFTR
jgi:NDP-sugar pyrophosphorylase family protein